MARSRPGRIDRRIVPVLAGVAILTLVACGAAATPSATPTTTPTAPATSPAAVPSPTPRPTKTPPPSPTPYVDVNAPLPVSWDDLSLPALTTPWALGETTSSAFSTKAVLRDDVEVGAIEQWANLPEAYTSFDLRAGGYDALLALAAEDLQAFVEGYASEEARVEPEAPREIAVAGGRGVRTSFTVIDASTGKATSRHTFVYHFDGRAVWMFATRWPRDPEFAAVGFAKLADQKAFDPELEALVAGLRLPAVLVTPEPVSP